MGGILTAYPKLLGASMGLVYQVPSVLGNLVTTTNANHLNAILVFIINRHLGCVGKEEPAVAGPSSEPTPAKARGLAGPRGALGPGYPEWLLERVVGRRQSLPLGLRRPKVTE